MSSFLKRSLLLMAAISVLACHREPADIPPENALAKISDRTISVGEFIRRSEYTPRPPYCRDGNYIHKKIILNSLIAEKLMALEGGEDNELAQNPSFQTFIKGRKEQAMRQWLYYKEAYEQVELDSSDIVRMVELAGRRYDILYYTMPNTGVANFVQEKLNQEGYSFEDVYREHFGGDSIPHRTVGWNIREDPTILASLFSHAISKGEVLGPLETREGSFLFMKVLGWTNLPAISSGDRQERRRGVVDFLTKEQAERKYESLVSKIMRGKSVQFFDQTFYAYADRAQRFYLKSKKEKESALATVIWDSERENPLDRTSPYEPEFKNRPFFELDDQVWTVGDVEQLMRSHPLVFRKRKMARGEFPEQFKFAVVDLMRDYYLTREAYNRGYDRVEAVTLNGGMWRDHFYAMDHRYQFLKSSGFSADFGENYRQAVKEHLNPYIDSLQAKYSSTIEIDVDQFENIELTKIDMFVTQRHVPYPIMVPSFPILTTDNRLDYGSDSGEKMKTSS